MVQSTPEETRLTSFWSGGSAARPNRLRGLCPHAARMTVSMLTRSTTSLLAVLLPVALAAAAPSAAKRLNSLVTELAHVRFDKRPQGDHIASPYSLIPFQRPRGGWVHISLDAQLGEGDKVWLTLGSDDILTGVGETMRLVKAGEHRLSIWTKGRPLLRSLTVRAVPEIMVYMFEALEPPRPQMWCRHTWELMDTCVLRNCNLVVSPTADRYAQHAAKWRQRGGRWLGNQGMIVLRNPKTDATLYWSSLLSKPMYDGVIHDELLPQDGSHYSRYADCLRRLKEHPVAGQETVYFFSPVSCIPNPARLAYFEIDRGGASDGKTALRCLACPGRVLTMRQLDVVLTPGTKYHLSVDLRTEGCKRGQFTGIFLIDEGWFTTHGSTIRPPEGDSDWQRCSKTFTPKPSRNDKYQIIVASPQEGKMWLDAIRVEEAEGKASEQNLVVNPSFEQGWEGWLEGLRKFKPFLDAVMTNGHKLAPELYMDEKPTEEAARDTISSRLVETMAAWRQHYVGIENHLLITLSAGNCAMRYSNDKCPQASYKVLLDMQFHALANEPAFEDLWGVGFWSGHYIDEELMRWYAALFRHYLIQGKRERLTDDPYLLDHLENPGFEDGTEGWTIEPAEAESAVVIAVADMPQKGARQKYCPVPEGGHVLRTRRTGARPNVMSQTIRSLELGRFYSLKLYNTDAGYTNRLIPVSIRLEGTDLQQANTLDHVWKKGKICWNYHYRVFRARSSEGQFVISDAQTGEVFWDFVQIEPYFAN